MLFGKNPARLLALNFVAFGALASQGMQKVYVLNPFRLWFKASQFQPTRFLSLQTKADKKLYALIGCS